jgi:hypothetical protein
VQVASFSLIGFGASEEQTRKVYASGPPRLGSRDPVASEIKCGPHGGKDNKTKLCTVFWLSLKTKLEPEQQRVKS